MLEGVNILHNKISNKPHWYLGFVLICKPKNHNSGKYGMIFKYFSGYTAHFPPPDSTNENKVTSLSKVLHHESELRK